MAKKEKQKPLIFDWDAAPNKDGGYTEIQLPGHPLYYLNYLKVRYDPEHRVLWWTDIAVPCDDVGRLEKVVMDFAPDIPAAMRAAEEAFLRLLKAPKFEIVSRSLPLENMSQTLDV